MGQEKVMRDAKRELIVAKPRCMAALRRPDERDDFGLVDRDPILDSIAQPGPDRVSELCEPLDRLR